MAAIFDVRSWIVGRGLRVHAAHNGARVVVHHCHRIKIAGLSASTALCTVVTQWGTQEVLEAQRTQQIGGSTCRPSLNRWSDSIDCRESWQISLELLLRHPCFFLHTHITGARGGRVIIRLIVRRSLGFGQ